MNRDRWIAIGIALGFHIALALFAFLYQIPAETQDALGQIRYVEIPVWDASQPVPAQKKDIRKPRSADTPPERMVFPNSETPDAPPGIDPGFDQGSEPDVLQYDGPDLSEERITGPPSAIPTDLEGEEFMRDGGHEPSPLPDFLDPSRQESAPAQAEESGMFIIWGQQNQIVEKRKPVFIPEVPEGLKREQTIAELKFRITVNPSGDVINVQYIDEKRTTVSIPLARDYLYRFKFERITSPENQTGTFILSIEPEQE